MNGVGYDGVDVAAVTEAGIFLANAPVLRDACADMAMLLMLWLAITNRVHFTLQPRK